MAYYVCVYVDPNAKPDDGDHIICVCSVQQATEYSDLTPFRATCAMSEWHVLRCKLNSSLILAFCVVLIFPFMIESLSTTLYNPSHCGPSPLWYSDVMVEHASHLIKSHFLLTGGQELVPMKVLVNDPTEAAKLLFFHPDKVVVSHGTQNSPEGPVFNYANSAAMKRWGASWEEFTTMHSKYSAEAVEQSERAEFLRRVLADGVVDDYSGIRIALDKRRY